MSCNCNAKYDNKIPCCCSTGTAVVCTTTICPDTQPCNQSVETDCVIYNKDYSCVGITSGMTVTEIMNIIYNSLNLIDCTTTVAPTCQCYLLINNTGGTLQYKYTPCGGSLSSAINLLSNQRIYRCSSTIPINVTLGIVVGTVFNRDCVRDNNCSNPIAYCHTITVTGSVNLQYINAQGILHTTGVITDASLNICAWENSIDKKYDSGLHGIYSIVQSDTICELDITCAL